MNFSEMQPDAGDMTINEEKGYERLHVAESVPAVECANGCGTLTRWANLSFEAPACSHECVDELWKSYFVRLKANLEMEQMLEAQGLSIEEAVISIIDDDVRNIYDEEPYSGPVVGGLTGKVDDTIN